jgi:ATP:corrinoid adenosyltransferase
MNLSQALRWLKTLKDRHQELLTLRNENSKREKRLWGDNKDIVTEPTYDVKVVDNLITKLAIEIRKLDEAIKETNAETTLIGYEKDEDVLGTLI